MHPPSFDQWEKSSTSASRWYKMPDGTSYLAVSHDEDGYALSHLSGGVAAPLGLFPNASRVVFAARQYEANGRRNQYVSGRPRRPLGARRVRYQGD